jgi:uncharacterized cysteine cluster protein YcgN (CxxCxxCC family)
MRCGRCCRLKTRLENGAVIFTPFSCRFQGLDGACSVYANRHRICGPTCLTIEQAIVAHCLPDDCPYVRNLPGYWGPRESPQLWKDPKLVRLCGQRFGIAPKEIERVVKECCG